MNYNTDDSTTQIQNINLLFFTKHVPLLGVALGVKVGACVVDVDFAKVMLYDRSPGVPGAVINVDGIDSVLSTVMSDAIWTVITGSLTLACSDSLGIVVVAGVAAVSKTFVEDPVPAEVKEDVGDTDGSPIEGSELLAPVSLGLAQVATRHCDIISLSIKTPFCLNGVKLRMYEVSKLPAPQPTRPTKTSECSLISLFWAQNAVRH